MGTRLTKLLPAAILCTCLSINAGQPTPTRLKVVERQITVEGRTAAVYGIEQPNGTFGLTANKDEQFNVILENTLSVPTSVHWHGLILPNEQDGVAFITQFPIYPGQSVHYQFPLEQAGTFWMHAHFSLQEQQLLFAPLILHEPDDQEIADQETVVLLADFSFKPPSQIYKQLRQGMVMSKNMTMKADIAEVEYDAFLANYRTLMKPDIVAVKPGAIVRLRFINAASATNFFLSLGKLSGKAIAVDGNRIHPLSGSRFELAAAQRIDILVTIPEQGGAFPILAQGAGTNKQTGIVLATGNSAPPALNMTAPFKAGALTNAQEARFTPLFPLPVRKPDQKITISMEGNMADYMWTLNGQSWPEVTPIVVMEGTRVEITFDNTSSMGHPMHLHGHIFEVTALNGKPIQGAMRDTLYVPAHSTATIQFDADNPGVWPLHCHILYHQEAGMMTVVRYKGFIQSL